MVSLKARGGKEKEIEPANAGQEGNQAKGGGTRIHSNWGEKWSFYSGRRKDSDQRVEKARGQGGGEMVGFAANVYVRVSQVSRKLPTGVGRAPQYP